MANIRALLAELAAREEQLRATQFLAPCVRGGTIRLRSGGLVYSFKPEPRGYEGWGIFRPLDERKARLLKEASLPLIYEYLKLCKPLRLLLVQRQRASTWMAYPANEADARQRFGKGGPLPVHLVTEGAQFEQVVARWDGRTCWFEELDRRADPFPAEHLRDWLRGDVMPVRAGVKGITPEMRAAYLLARRGATHLKKSARRMTDEERLREALKLGGGSLRGFQDQGDSWAVEWMIDDDYPSPEIYNSMIAKSDLTVLSAGICLSERDRDFDLQSLVKVVEQWC